MYKEVNTISNFSELESDVISFWKKNNIFEKSVEQRPEDNLYVFYDGPPFISGLPHYGHLLGSIAKDVIPRYWTMKGKRVERVWGWDAHGLTVENKVQKKLGIKNRKDIETYGLQKFTEECYKYTSETSAEWDWYVDRIGRWVDIKNAYKTIDQSYMESVMWAFKELYSKGLIYEGVRTSLYCTTCGTPVSNFEVAMDNTYKDVEDPAVTVKFELTSGEFSGAFVLAWTTTPWTLPSNRALVVAENETYVIAEVYGEKLIAAKNLLDSVFEGKEYSVVKELKGKELVGLKYKPLYTFFAGNEHDFKVYGYEGMANVTEGTGIVHSAPGFGAIDTEMGMACGLTIMLTIDDEGHFGPGDNGENPFEGDYYKKSDKRIREDLEERGLLFKDERIVHRFPYHDRCDTLLIHRAQNSWFVDVQQLKDSMLKENENINWVPSHLKHGRFKHVIETAPDWCISRNRFWATPMPVWESEDGERIVIGSVKELEELSGQEVKDLHRPYIDEITIEKDGKTYKRVEEVLDSWFEAGSMPYAQIHYPFENQEKFEKNFPGDYIVEYIAQVRAWFNVMHRLSVALFGKNSFKNVISTGVMAGNDGRKMSKTYGNYTDPKEVLETIGGDSLRLYLMNSPLMVGDNANFDDIELKNKSKKVLNPLWNSLKYFVTYANSNNWKSSNTKSSDNVLDKWIIAKLHITIKEITSNIENYTIPAATQAVEDFVDDLSRWYVRRSRDRISSGDVDSLNTLFTVLLEFSKAAAPVIPFITEGMYLVLAEDLENAPESVHLCEYPTFNEDFIKENSQLVEDMELVRRVASLGNSIRKESNITLRQPLAEMEIAGFDHISEELKQVLMEELNIKSITVVSEVNSDWLTQDFKDLKVSINPELTDDLKIEGEKREVIRKLQGLRKKKGLSVSDVIEVATYPASISPDTIKIYGDEIKEKVNAQELEQGDKYGFKEV